MSLSALIYILGITSCGDESVKLNSIINAKIESKKLRLSGIKCFKIHISKSEKSCLVKLKAHENQINEVKSAPYLGDIINEKGNIDDTIASRKTKSIGIISQIMSILNSVSLGMFYMDVALILRDSMFLNGILTNCEIWYNMKEEHVKTLEVADNDLMRKIFNAHSKTGTELFFLEAGKIPIRFMISKRRLMYLWHILKQDGKELIKKIYNVQKVKFTKGDWYEMIQNEKKKYQINLEDDEISEMSNTKFKNIIEKKVYEVAFKFLKEKATNHSKSQDILDEIKERNTHSRKTYLKENVLPKTDCQLLFSMRTKMIDVKANFKYLYGDVEHVKKKEVWRMKITF